MKLYSRLFLMLWLWAGSAALAQSTLPSRPIAEIRHVLIILVDGLRPDLALRGDTPAIHQMLKDGSFTFWAKTTPESVTLPSITSILTGAIPIRHGILWDKDLPTTQPTYADYPTIFAIARRVGYTTAMAVGKSKLISLATPGSLNWSFITDQTKCEDAEVLAHAVEILVDHRPDVMFVHFPSVDNVGHAGGWGSDAQMVAISRADVGIHLLVSTLDELGLADSTMVIVTADHGGAGYTHDPDDSRSRNIPWIVTGPGIRRGLDLSIYGDLTVNTEDTFSTCCYVLGLRPHKLPIDGKPVMRIFDAGDGELMRDK